MSGQNPTLGICITVKFPWVARCPPPLGLDIDRCIKWRCFISGNYARLYCSRFVSPRDACFLVPRVGRTFMCMQCTYQYQARAGGGSGAGIGWGFWHFLKEIIKIPTPGQRIIVKISRNKWFTSHLLFKIDRSNAWCQVKIPTLGICITVKFPWVARTPPPPWHW